MRRLFFVFFGLFAWSQAFAQTVEVPLFKFWDPTNGLGTLNDWVINSLDPVIADLFAGVPVVVTATGTASCSATTTIFAPLLPATTTCLLPSFPFDGEVHTLIDDDTTGASLSLSGNGKTIAPYGDTSISVASPGSATVIYTKVSDRWELAR